MSSTAQKLDDTEEAPALGTKILARKEGGIGWLTFNNPERRNAMSGEMWQAVCDVVDDFAADASVRVMVMHGAGGKSFVSGADISKFEKHRKDAAAAEAYRKIPDTGRQKLADFPKPMIAMVDGFCLGGGLGIAMKADIRIASEQSQFGIPAAKLGIAYSFSNLRALVDLVGPAFAKEILFTGRRLNADEALSIGLVNKVVPASELEAVVRGYAAEIAANSPLSIKASKVTIGQVVADPDKRDMSVIDQMTRDCFDSQDYIEGRTAFMEKRKPTFTGR